MHSSSRSVRAVVCCTAVLLPLLVLGAAAQSVDVAAICGRGDSSRPMKFVSADSHRMQIHCPRLSEYCTIESTVAMDEQAASTLCAPVNGARNTIAVDRAVVVQVPRSPSNYLRRCSRMLDMPDQMHLVGAAEFENAKVQEEWKHLTGTRTTVSVCGNPEKGVVVCGSGDAASAKRGEPQLCGEGGMYQAVYTGMDGSGTNGCNGTDKRLFFTIIGVPEGMEYNVFNLFFEEPVVTSVVTLNGTQQTVTTNASPDVPVSVIVDVVNPLEGKLFASRLGANGGQVGTNRMQPGSCTGYCAFEKDPEDTRNWLPMTATCAGATPTCQVGVTASSCAAEVQLFQSSAEDITIPSGSDDSVRYELKDENRVVVSMSGNVLPLKGVFVFNQTAAERVTDEGAARDLSGAKAHVLRQDAQHKDVAVVRAGGEVATASVACEFALRSVRGTDRMYSVTNVRGGPNCDLVIGNGVDQQTFTLASPAKASGAREVDDYEALWEEADTVNEGGPKNLPLILGLSLGLGLGLLVVIAVIVIVVVCCRRNKTCCFADGARHHDSDVSDREHDDIGAHRKRRSLGRRRNSGSGSDNEAGGDRAPNPYRMPRWVNGIETEVSMEMSSFLNDFPELSSMDMVIPKYSTRGDNAPGSHGEPRHRSRKRRGLSSSSVPRAPVVTFVSETNSEQPWAAPRDFASFEDIASDDVFAFSYDELPPRREGILSRPTVTKGNYNPKVTWTRYKPKSLSRADKDRNSLVKSGMSRMALHEFERICDNKARMGIPPLAGHKGEPPDIATFTEAYPPPIHRFGSKEYVLMNFIVPVEEPYYYDTPLEYYDVSQRTLRNAFNTISKMKQTRLTYLMMYIVAEEYLYQDYARDEPLADKPAGMSTVKIAFH